MVHDGRGRHCRTSLLTRISSLAENRMRRFEQNAKRRRRLDVTTVAT
jgi:hypothetical protein